VLGNGDVACGADAKRMFEQTGVDGIMVARGAQGNPWIFQELLEVEQTWMQETLLSSGSCAAQDNEIACNIAKAQTVFHISTEQRRSMMLRHAILLIETKGEYIGIREMRKHFAWYTKGIKGAGHLRDEANHVENLAEFQALLTKLD